MGTSSLLLPKPKRGSGFFRERHEGKQQFGEPLTPPQLLSLPAAVWPDATGLPSLRLSSPVRAGRWAVGYDGGSSCVSAPLAFSFSLLVMQRQRGDT